MVTDPNGNRAAVAFDVLGLVTATAMMGKTTRGRWRPADRLHRRPGRGGAGWRSSPTRSPARRRSWGTPPPVACTTSAAYQRTAASPQPAPPAAYTLARETHVSDLAAPPYPGAPASTGYQYTSVYSDGFGREVQRKAQVARWPGDRRRPGGLAALGGSGWTIFDNKGRPVREVRAVLLRDQRLRVRRDQTASATVTLYDPPGRAVATLHPDSSWDEDGHRPVAGAAAGTATTRCSSPTRAPTPTSGTTSPAAAGRARSRPGTSCASAAATARRPRTGRRSRRRRRRRPAPPPRPRSAHRDALGRGCLAVADNGGDGRYPSRTAYDTEGKPLAVIDPLGRRAAEFCYRQPVTGAGVPGRHGPGGRSALPRDLRRRRAPRPVQRGRRSDQVLGRARARVPGGLRPGAAPDATVRQLGRRARRSSSSCRSTARASRPRTCAAGSSGTTTPRATWKIAGYDYAGNLVATVRQLAAGYRQAVDWTPLAGLAAAAALDAAAASHGLVPVGDGGRDAFTSATSYDALNRPVQLVLPHNTAMQPDVLQPGYDEAAQLRAVDVWLQQATAPAALLDPATASRHAVTSIELQRPRPADLDRLRQWHQLGLRLRPADLPADPADHHPARRAGREPAHRPGPRLLL